MIGAINSTSTQNLIRFSMTFFCSLSFGGRREKKLLIFHKTRQFLISTTRLSVRLGCLSKHASIVKSFTFVFRSSCVWSFNNATRSNSGELFNCTKRESCKRRARNYLCVLAYNNSWGVSNQTGNYLFAQHSRVLLAPSNLASCYLLGSGRPDFLFWFWLARSQASLKRVALLLCAI